MNSFVEGGQETFYGRRSLLYVNPLDLLMFPPIRVTRVLLYFVSHTGRSWCPKPLQFSPDDPGVFPDDLVVSPSGE